MLSVLHVKRLVVFFFSFVLSGNLHGGSVVASYPFDDSPSHEQQGHYSQTEDDSLFRHLAQVYSYNHPVMRIGQPNCSDSIDETFKDGITNGAQWYDVPGKSAHIKSCLWLLSLVVESLLEKKRSSQQFVVSLHLVSGSQNMKFYFKNKGL